MVIGQGSVGCQHLAAFHTHLCNRAQRLMAKLCKGMTMDVDDLMDMVRTDAQPCSQDDQASAFMGKRIEAWPAPDGPDAQRWGACADELVHTLLVMVHIDGGEHVGRGGGEWNGKRGYDGQHSAEKKRDTQAPPCAKKEEGTPEPRPASAAHRQSPQKQKVWLVHAEWHHRRLRHCRPAPPKKRNNPHQAHISSCSPKKRSAPSTIACTGSPSRAPELCNLRLHGARARDEGILSGCTMFTLVHRCRVVCVQSIAKQQRDFLRTQCGGTIARVLSARASKLVLAYTQVLRPLHMCMHLARQHDDEPMACDDVCFLACTTRGRIRARQLRRAWQRHWEQFACAWPEPQQRPPASLTYSAYRHVAIALQCSVLLPRAVASATMHASQLVSIGKRGRGDEPRKEGGATFGVCVCVGPLGWQAGEKDGEGRTSPLCPHPYHKKKGGALLAPPKKTCASYSRAQTASCPKKRRTTVAVCPALPKPCFPPHAHL